MRRALFPILFMVCGIAAVALVDHFPFIAAPLGVVAAISFFITFKESNAESRAISAQTTATDKQLRAEVIAAQKLAFTKLATADDAFKTQVAEQIADAAMHLGSPQALSGRVVTPTGYTLAWNKEGLAKIAAVRKLIDEFVPATAK